MGVIGGSAGGSHDVYLAGTGTKGDDRSMRPWRSLELTIYRQGSLGLQHFWRIVKKMSARPGRKICARRHRFPTSMRQSRLFTSSLRMTNPCCHNNSRISSAN